MSDCNPTINGGLLQPLETDPMFEAWETCNNIVVSWISRSLSPQISQSTVSIDNARELWLDLQERFTKGNYFRMSHLLQDLHSMKKGDRTLTNYFTNLKILWDELEHLRPTPTCSCQTVCTCDLSKAAKRFKEVEYVICFLKGLNDNYSNVKTQILLMDPLPPINRTFALADQQDTPPHTSLVPQHLLQPLHQIPKIGLRLTKAKVAENPGLLCFAHTAKRQITPLTIATSNTAFPRVIEQDPKLRHFKASLSQASNNAESTMPISWEDYNHFVKLLQHSKQENSSSMVSANKHQNFDSSNHFVSRMNTSGISITHCHSWILDSGASDHVSPFINLFSKLHSINPIPIQFPDGTTINAHFSGTIPISDTLCLTDVLYIPQFKFNLLSIYKLTFANQCKVIFSPIFCGIQDLHTQRMIGHVSLHNNLYIFHHSDFHKSCNFNSAVPQSINTVKHNSDTTNLDIWHCRLGHPCNQVLQQLCTQFPYVSYN